MSVWDIISIVVGSGAMAALVNLLSDRLRRRDAVSDRRDGTADQIEELRAETSEQFGQVDKRIHCIEGKIDTLDANTKNILLCTKAQAYDRIRHLGMAYIKAGSIGEDELRNLTEMHEAYKLIGGDGFLDKVMAEVGRLRMKPND